jgi:hypothetical protein
MAGSRKPGPQCLYNDPVSIDDGTMCRAMSPRPGPLDAATTPTRTRLSGRPLHSEDRANSSAVSGFPGRFANGLMVYGRIIEPVPTAAGEINVALPREGTGFRSYKTQNTQYGYPQTVEFIMKLGAQWAKANPQGPRLLIGDLSIKGGGATPKQWGKPEAGYHKSHGSGLDFDVQVIRTDNIEDPRSVSVRDALYDRRRTQNLVNVVREVAGKCFGLILSADSQLKGIHVDDTHVYHLHVRLRKST